ncbi:methionyl-tRNA formyltransferase [Candidatus Kaiserbacteria bacterium]|nr:MAG: methionyl-tRNA formyltransferase [Candidatus Kaiserbacteria bacterium]
MDTPTTKFVFFGTPKLSTIVLDELESRGLLPSLVVTAPDKPSGRGMKMNSSPVKQWAQKRSIPTMEPESFSDEEITQLTDEAADVFVLVAYGKILPQSVIDISPKGILNVHPSLLPKFRGPSPVRSAILQDVKTTGVSVMLIDKKMDHGPVLVQEEYTPEIWPPNARDLDNYLFTRGGALLAEILPQYLTGDVFLKEQNHDEATYCKLFTKEDGLLNLDDDPYQNLLKIHAYAGWPGTFFFSNDVRITVTQAHIENDALVLDEVIPEGKKKMSYEAYLQS